MQHGAILGDVDLVAAEHGVDAPAQVGLVGQPAQQRQRLVGDAVLGVVEKDAGRLGGQPLAACRVVREQLCGGAAARIVSCVRQRAPVHAGRSVSGTIPIDSSF